MRTHRGLLACLLAWAMPAVGADAPEPLLRFLHVPPERSFASRWILDAAQDSRGFIWFASLNGGFARYDGYQFRTYRHDPNDPSSAPSNTVHAVYPDPQESRLWVSMAQGLVGLDLDTDELTLFRHDPADPVSIGPGGVYRVLRDRAGNLWVGTESGVSVMAAGDTGFRHPPLQGADDPADLGPAGWVMALHEDRAGTVWVGSFGGGLLRYDARNDRFTRFLHDPESPHSLPDAHNSVRSVFEDSRGRLWVGTDEAAAVMTDRTTGRFERVVDGAVRSIAEDQAGNLWIGTRDGLLFREAGTESFVTLRHDATDPNSVGPGLINSVLVDHAGNLWAPGDQISFVPPSAHAFAVYANDALQMDAADLYLDREGRAWVGTRTGLHGLDLETGAWREYQPFPDSENPDANWVFGAGVHQDASGQLWVTTYQALSRFDPGTGRFESRDLPTAPSDLHVDADGTLWLALPYRGLWRYDFESGESVAYVHDPQNPSSISHDFGYRLMEGSDGALWYASYDGLNRFDRETGTARRYYHDEADPRSLSNSSIRSAFVDSRGRLWLGTEFGLNRYDPDTDDFTRFLDGTEPSRNVFLSFVEADDGSLWLGTDAGLSHFDPDSGSFTAFSHADGVPAGFIPDLNAGPDGGLFALAPAGVLRIDAARLSPDVQPPRLAWTDLVVLQRDQGLTPPVVPPPRLELTHRDRLFTVGFAALDLADPGAARYAYRLRGLHDDWVTTDALRRSATFTDLPRGDYTLELRAADGRGRWNETGLFLPIRVLPPPWRTWWAYLAYALASVTLLQQFVAWRTRSHRQRQAELERAVRERTTRLEASEQRIREQTLSLEELLALKERLFTNISHEFRTPLTLMLGPIEHARRATEDPVMARELGMAHRNGRRVLRLVDQLLELSRLSSHAPPTDEPQPVHPVAAGVVDAFEPMVRQRGLTLTFIGDDTLWTRMPAEALERVLMNLLSNAVKFNRDGGAIELRIDAVGEDVRLRVSDTGTGIPRERLDRVFDRFARVDDRGEAIAGSGIGLALVSELVEAHGGTVEVSSAEGEGTTFTVRLPRYLPPRGLQVQRTAAPSEALQLEVDALEPAERDDTPRDDGDADRPSVLVVEDNPDMRAYLEGLLGADYRVLTATDGEEGLAIADREVPDLVVCDFTLPGMAGDAVAGTLRRTTATSHIPVIMLTARSDQESRMRGLREQVDDYLVKPFNDEELLLRIANLLAIRDILRARYSGAMVADAAPAATLNAPERDFLARLEGVLETHYASEDFTIAAMAAELCMSERQLQRKLKAITGQTPALYLRLFRLRRSLALLAEGERVGDAAYAVGFSSPAYFASCFRAQFGCTPTEFQTDPSRMNTHGPTRA